MDGLVLSYVANYNFLGNVVLFVLLNPVVFLYFVQKLGLSDAEPPGQFFAYSVAHLDALVGAFLHHVAHPW